MNLRLHQLRALLGVVEHGSIRAAARAMHLSQAALTKSLRELEEDAGVPLLVRSPRGVGVTAAGERLLARARLIGRQLELAGDELREAAGDVGGQVRLGLTPYVALAHLGRAFNAFRQRHAQVALAVSDGLMTRVLPRLRDGTLDLAVVADLGDLPIGEFDTQVLRVLEQHAVVRAGHPVLAAPATEALARLEWVLTGPPNALRSSRFRAVFARAGAEPPARVLSADTLAALALLRHTDVAAFMPAPLLALPEAHGLVRVPTTLAPGALRLVLLTRADAPLTPAAAHFAQCLREAMQSAAAAH